MEKFLLLKKIHPLIFRIFLKLPEIKQRFRISDFDPDDNPSFKYQINPFFKIWIQNGTRRNDKSCITFSYWSAKWLKVDFENLNNFFLYGFSPLMLGPISESWIQLYTGYGGRLWSGDLDLW